MWIFWTIVLSIITIILFFYSCTGKGWQGLAGQLFVWCLLSVFIMIVGNTHKPKPTTLDVYRVNTELRITSINGVPSDTVVVFKSK